MDIGKSLACGKAANRALYCTFFSYAAQYQPLFVFLVGVASNITGGDIIGGRFFSVSVGLATALVGFWFFHRRFGYLCGLAFALLCLGFNQAIIHYRWIYPHNLVGLSVLGAVAILMRPAKLPQDLKAGAFLVLGVGSHFLGFLNAAFLCLFRIKSFRSLAAVSLPPMIFFSAIFIWSTLLFKNWPAEDLGNLIKIYNQHSAQNAGGLKLFKNFYFFFVQDYFHIAAFLGMLLCLRTRSSKLALSALGLSFLILRNRQNLTYFYYQAMIVFPLFCSVIAVGFYRTLNLLWRGLGLQGEKLRWARCCLPFGCLLLALTSLPAVFRGQLPIRISPFVVQDIAGYESAAKWINDRTNDNDLVIAYWNFGWMLKCRNSDILMSTAWFGLPGGDVFDPPPERSRFRYPAGVEYAKFFVITDQDLLWAFNQPNVSVVLQRFKVFEWPIVFQTESVKVLKNPQLSPP